MRFEAAALRKTLNATKRPLPSALLASEWVPCLLLREELAYTVDGEQGDSQEAVRPGMGSQPAQNRLEAVRPGMGSQPMQNRFSGDWTALHMMATVARLTVRHAASYSIMLLVF